MRMVPDQWLRLLASSFRQANLKLFRSCYGCLPGLVQVIHPWGQRLGYAMRTTVLVASFVNGVKMSTGHSFSVLI